MLGFCPPARHAYRWDGEGVRRRQIILAALAFMPKLPNTTNSSAKVCCSAELAEQDNIPLLSMEWLGSNVEVAVVVAVCVVVCVGAAAGIRRQGRERSERLR